MTGPARSVLFARKLRIPIVTEGASVPGDVSISRPRIRFLGKRFRDVIPSQLLWTPNTVNVDVR
ncbi:hypothetical protein A4G99_14895 [Haladaptatus sp. R4]|nr:hypothetical protein A4G99_14895 [Haladaptatus sp. R4]